MAESSEVLNATKQSYSGLYSCLKKVLHHFQILILNGNDQGTPAQRIHAIDVKYVLFTP